jgi:O-antigen/teichoic acid export membrane protein
MLDSLVPDPEGPILEDHAATVRESLSRNVTVDVAARIGYLVSRFFIPPFVLAHVTLEAYGLWSTAFIVVSYVGLSTMGISTVYIKFVAEYCARRDYLKANQLLSTGLCLTVPFCSIVFACFYFLWPHMVIWLHIAPALRGDAREVVLSVVATFLASLSLGAFHDVVVGAQKTDMVQRRWMICYIVETILIFVLVGMGRGIRGLSEAFLVRTIIDVVLCLIMAVRLLPWLRISPRLITREAFHNLFAFGAIVQIQGLISIFLDSVERAIAAPLVGLAGTGLLEIGKKLPSMAGSVPIAFTSSFTPAASYVHGGLESSQNQAEMVRRLYLRGARYMNLASAYFCGLLVAIPEPILKVWMGKHYAGAAYLVVIFSISTQVHLMTGPGTSILRGISRLNEEFHYALPNIAVLLLAVPLSRLILGQWTALGIATAVAASTLVAATYFVGHANRILKISSADYWKTVVLPGVVPYLVGLPFIVPAAYVVAHTGRWVSAAWIAAMGLIYSLVLMAVVDTLVWSSSERYWFRGMISSRLARFLPLKNRMAQLVTPEGKETGHESHTI